MKPCVFIILAVLAIALSESPAQTNQQLVDDQIARYEKADKKMNAAYRQLLGILDNAGKGSLREAQRAWLAWRDVQAKFDSHHLAGGSLRPVEEYGSRIQSTDDRTKKLEEDYKRFKEM